MELHVTLPSKPKIVSESQNSGVFEIDGLYPGYGHTLGNSLRRIILSSLPGAAITKVKIEGVPHEFSTKEGVKEDIITILLNLKKVRLSLIGDDTQTIALKIKGPKNVTAADFTLPTQVSVHNPEQYICDVTSKTEFYAELTVQKGIGYVPREQIQEDKVDVGTIALDAAFTPIRRVNYEVENMRVGDRTDYNRLRITIETDGTVTPKEALEKSIEIMIYQLKSVIGFQDPKETFSRDEEAKESRAIEAPVKESKETHEGKEDDVEMLKTRIETLSLSTRTVSALGVAGIRTVGGLARKREDDILAIEGLGVKGLQEIKRALSNFGITLRS
jgi:DNA-directed RNA polymerase subunit alpha